MTMKMRRHISLVWLVAILVSAWPQSLSAVSNFSYETDVTYRVEADGTTKVTENFTVRNNTAQLYLTELRLSTPTDSVTDLSARYSDGAPISATATKTGAKRGDVDSNYHEIKVTFPRQIVGLNRRWSFSVAYTAGGLTEIRGGSRQVFIPYLDPADDRERYSVRVDVPKSFGTPHFPGAKADSGGMLGDRQFYNFSRQDLENNPLAALVFGDKTVYEVNFKYPLRNDSILPKTFTVTLPPDTNNQTSRIKKLSPAPSATRLDSDGNVLADYRLAPRQHLVVDTEVAIEVRYLEYDLAASTTADKIPKELADRYTGPSRYWSFEGGVKEQAAKLVDPKAPVINNVRAVHQFVIDKLTYNKDKIKFNIRQGAEKALAQPDNAVCLEYADLLVAMLRSQGIPARMPVGYAYRNDLKNSNSVADSLHAWAEVYVPGIGWMTLDPTWSEDNGNLFGTSDFDHVAFAVWGQSDQIPDAVMVGQQTTNYQYEDATLSFKAEVADSQPGGRVKAWRHILLPFISMDRVKLEARPEIASDNNQVVVGHRKIDLGSLAPQQRMTVRQLVLGQDWNRREEVKLIHANGEVIVLATTGLRNDYLPMVLLLASVSAGIARLLYKRRIRSSKVEITTEEVK
jgi:transglutaminase-like putative cysteine protease